jgi:hypothetical protein
MDVGMKHLEVKRFSAVSRRFSPDMELRWLPTVNGKVIVGGAIPFSGFDTRAQAVAAAGVAASPACEELS